MNERACLVDELASESRGLSSALPAWEESQLEVEASSTTAAARTSAHTYMQFSHPEWTEGLRAVCIPVDFPCDWLWPPGLYSFLTPAVERALLALCYMVTPEEGEAGAVTGIYLLSLLSQTWCSLHLKNSEWCSRKMLDSILFTTSGVNVLIQIPCYIFKNSSFYNMH